MAVGRQELVARVTEYVSKSFSTVFSTVRLNLNPAVAAGRNPDRPSAQPVAKKTVITRRVSCAAVGNCWYQGPCLAVWGMNCRI